jgi:hypothetical protein
MSGGHEYGEFHNLVEEVKGKLLKIVQRYNALGESIGGSEEQTKNSLIRPFFEALGYNFEDPRDVYSEEIINDKGKAYEGRVDYVIKFGDNSDKDFIIECKKLGWDLGKSYGQLHRYADGCKSEFILAVLTNGVKYRFFSWVAKKRGSLDEKPFLDFDILRIVNDLTLLESLCVFHRKYVNKLTCRELAKIVRSFYEGKFGYSNVSEYFTRGISKPNVEEVEDEGAEQVRLAYPGELGRLGVIRVVCQEAGYEVEGYATKHLYSIKIKDGQRFCHFAAAKASKKIVLYTDGGDVSKSFSGADGLRGLKDDILAAVRRVVR